MDQVRSKMTYTRRVRVVGRVEGQNWYGQSVWKYFGKTVYFEVGERPLKKILHELCKDGDFQPDTARIASLQLTLIYDKGSRTVTRFRFVQGKCHQEYFTEPYPNYMEDADDFQLEEREYV